MAERSGEAGVMKRRGLGMRRSRSRTSPIPDELCKLAIDAARQQGSIGPSSSCIWTPATNEFEDQAEPRERTGTNHSPDKSDSP
jgi:hypothetical protein